jgi:protein-S-isoprenylcysteine O-methyltransferase Ste14
MEAVAALAPAPIDAKPQLTMAWLRNAVSNCLLGAAFVVAAWPIAHKLSFDPAGLANAVWVVGAAIMGVMCLARFAPRSTTVNPSTLLTSGVMLVFPGLMRPTTHSIGALATVGVVLELSGVILTQVARIYMGRSFGVLPANRGIVSKGPFRYMRHPVYFGWLVLSTGFAMCNPSWRNILIIVATLPFMVWRIDQEESHLKADPEYRAYMARVRFRLWPGEFTAMIHRPGKIAPG